MPTARRHPTDRLLAARPGPAARTRNRRRWTTIALWALALPLCGADAGADALIDQALADAGAPQAWTADVLQLQGCGAAGLQALEARIHAAGQDRVATLTRLQDCLLYPDQVSGVMTIRTTAFGNGDAIPVGVIVTRINGHDIHGLDDLDDALPAPHQQATLSLAGLSHGSAWTATVTADAAGIEWAPYPNDVVRYLHGPHRDPAWDAEAKQGLLAVRAGQCAPGIAHCTAALQAHCNDPYVLAALLLATASRQGPAAALAQVAAWRTQVAQPLAADSGQRWLEIVICRCLLEQGTLAGLPARLDAVRAAAEQAGDAHNADIAAIYLTLARGGQDLAQASDALQQALARMRTRGESVRFWLPTLAAMLSEQGRWQDAAALAAWGRPGSFSTDAWAAMKIWAPVEATAMPSQWALVFHADLDHADVAERLGDLPGLDHLSPHQFTHGALVLAAADPGAFSEAMWSCYADGVRISADVRVLDIPDPVARLPFLHLGGLYSYTENGLELGVDLGVDHLAGGSFKSQPLLAYQPWLDSSLAAVHHLEFSYAKGRAESRVDGHLVDIQLAPPQLLGRCTIRTGGATFALSNLEITVPSAGPVDNEAIRRHYQAADQQLQTSLADALGELEQAASLQPSLEELSRLYASYLIAGTSSGAEADRALAARLAGISDRRQLSLWVQAEKQLDILRMPATGDGFFLARDLATDIQELIVPEAVALPRCAASRDPALRALYAEARYALALNHRGSETDAEAALAENLTINPDCIGHVVRMLDYQSSHHDHQGVEPLLARLRPLLPHAAFLTQPWPTDDLDLSLEGAWKRAHYTGETGATGQPPAAAPIAEVPAHRKAVDAILKQLDALLADQHTAKALQTLDHALADPGLADQHDRLQVERRALDAFGAVDQAILAGLASLLDGKPVDLTLRDGTHLHLAGATNLKAKQMRAQGLVVEGDAGGMTYDRTIQPDQLDHATQVLLSERAGSPALSATLDACWAFLDAVRSGSVSAPAQERLRLALETVAASQAKGGDAALLGALTGALQRRQGITPAKAKADPFAGNPYAKLKVGDWVTYSEFWGRSSIKKTVAQRDDHQIVLSVEEQGKVSKDTYDLAATIDLCVLNFHGAKGEPGPPEDLTVGGKLYHCQVYHALIQQDGTLYADAKLWTSADAPFDGVLKVEVTWDKERSDPARITGPYAYEMELSGSGSAAPGK